MSNRDKGFRPTGLSDVPDWNVRSIHLRFLSEGVATSGGRREGRGKAVARKVSLRSRRPSGERRLRSSAKYPLPSSHFRSSRLPGNLDAPASYVPVIFKGHRAVSVRQNTPHLESRLNTSCLHSDFISSTHASNQEWYGVRSAGLERKPAVVGSYTAHYGFSQRDNPDWS